MVKTICIAVLMSSVAAIAEQAIIWDSRFASNPPTTSLRSIDAGITNLYINPDYRPEFRSAPLPALWNSKTKTLTPWVGTHTGTLDAAESARTNRFTQTQRAGHQELRSIKQAMGLPAKADDDRLIELLLENSRTNSTGTAGAAATRLLSRAQSALWLQEYIKPESE